MIEPTSLKQIIQDMMPFETGVITGRVVSVGPLKIIAHGDAALVLNEHVLCVPSYLTDHKLSAETEEGEIEMTVKNALAPGDSVYILSYNRGKKYYILDRKSDSDD